MQRGESKAWSKKRQKERRLYANFSIFAVWHTLAKDEVKSVLYEDNFLQLGQPNGRRNAKEDVVKHIAQN